MNIWQRVKALVTGGQLVWLEDSDNEAVLRVAYKTPFGRLVAWRLAHNLITLKDGGDAEVNEWGVKRWKFAD